MFNTFKTIPAIIFSGILVSCSPPFSKGIKQSTVPRSISNASTKSDSSSSQPLTEFIGKREFISYAPKTLFDQGPSKTLRSDVLLPGDQIEITLLEKLPVSQEKRIEIKRIDENGEVFIFPIGTILLSGLTLTESRNLIEKKMQSYIISPLCEITILKREYEPHIFVFGEILKPGSVPLKEGNRLLDILSATGGTTQNAFTSSIKLVRLEKDSIAILTINLGDILKRGRIENNLLMQDQDIIYVPKNILSGVSDILGKLGSILPWYYFVNNF